MQQNVSQVKIIYLQSIKDFINMKSLMYCVKYMLYRNQKYEWLILADKRIHPKIGDLRDRQRDIKKSLPLFRKRFERFSESLFGDTDRILLDSEDFLSFKSNISYHSFKN